MAKDFDGGLIGSTISQALTPSSSLSKISWEVKPASLFPRGVVDVKQAIYDEETWVVVTSELSQFVASISRHLFLVSEGATNRLNSALANPNATYDGSEAISVLAVEARNENA